MNEISVKQVFAAVIRSIWLAVIVAIVFGASAYFYTTNFVSNVYTARSSIFITNGGILNSGSGTNVKNTDFTASTMLLQPCVDILKTKEAQKDLVNSMNSSITYNDIKGGFQISIRSDNSLFIDIRYSGNDKDQVIKLVNEYAEFAPEYLSGFFNNTINIKTVELATAASKVSPRTTVISISAAFIGAVLVMLVSVILSLLDQTIKGEADFTANYDVPVLGVVPDFELLKK